MRPDKPGQYWVRTSLGDEVVKYKMHQKWEVIEGGAGSRTVEQFESSKYFIGWLGPAHPPKRVKSFPGRYWEGNKDVGVREMVLLDDVREFLLEE